MWVVERLVVCITTLRPRIKSISAWRAPGVRSSVRSPFRLTAHFGVQVLLFATVQWSRRERLPVRSARRISKSCFYHRKFNIRFQVSRARRTCACIDQHRRTPRVVRLGASGSPALLRMEERRSPSQKVGRSAWSLGENVSSLSRFVGCLLGR